MSIPFSFKSSAGTTGTPVFSHEDPLCFIWCIAGERYWVGDKNKDFMTAKVDKLTT